MYSRCALSRAVSAAHGGGGGESGGGDGEVGVGRARTGSVRGMALVLRVLTKELKAGGGGGGGDAAARWKGDAVSLQVSFLL
jgi:hypothetical protein